MFGSNPPNWFFGFIASVITIVVALGVFIVIEQLYFSDRPMEAFGLKLNQPKYTGKIPDEKPEKATNNTRKESSPVASSSKENTEIDTVEAPKKELDPLPVAKPTNIVDEKSEERIDEIAKNSESAVDLESPRVIAQLPLQRPRSVAQNSLYVQKTGTNAAAFKVPENTPTLIRATRDAMFQQRFHVFSKLENEDEYTYIETYEDSGIYTLNSKQSAMDYAITVEHKDRRWKDSMLVEIHNNNGESALRFEDSGQNIDNERNFDYLLNLSYQ